LEPAFISQLETQRPPAGKTRKSWCGTNQLFMVLSWNESIALPDDRAKHSSSRAIEVRPATWVNLAKSGLDSTQDPLFVVYIVVS